MRPGLCCTGGTISNAGRRANAGGRLHHLALLVEADSRGCHRHRQLRPHHHREGHPLHDPAHLPTLRPRRHLLQRGGPTFPDLSKWSPCSPECLFLHYDISISFAVVCSLVVSIHACWTFVVLCMFMQLLELLDVHDPRHPQAMVLLIPAGLGCGRHRAFAVRLPHQTSLIHIVPEHTI